MIISCIKWNKMWWVIIGSVREMVAKLNLLVRCDACTFCFVYDLYTVHMKLQLKWCYSSNFINEMIRPGISIHPLLEFHLCVYDENFNLNLNCIYTHRRPLLSFFLFIFRCFCSFGVVVRIVSNIWCVCALNLVNSLMGRRIYAWGKLSPSYIKSTALRIIILKIHQKSRLIV